MNAPNFADKGDLLTTKEVARLSGLPVERVRYLCESGQLAGVQRITRGLPTWYVLPDSLMAHCQPQAPRFTRFRVDCSAYENRFNLPLGAVLRVDTQERIRTGKLVVFVYRGWSRIGLYWFRQILTTDGALERADVQIIGTVAAQRSRVCLAA